MDSFKRDTTAAIIDTEIATSELKRVVQKHERRINQLEYQLAEARRMIEALVGGNG